MMCGFGVVLSVVHGCSSRGRGAGLGWRTRNSLASIGKDKSQFRPSKYRVASIKDCIVSKESSEMLDPSQLSPSSKYNFQSQLLWF